MNCHHTGRVVRMPDATTAEMGRMDRPADNAIFLISQIASNIIARNRHARGNPRCPRRAVALLELSEKFEEFEKCQSSQNMPTMKAIIIRPKAMRLIILAFMFIIDI